jgi:glycosyltransferase involved in cell wall biosynthesis
VVEEFAPDVVLIYNDAFVTHRVLEELKGMVDPPRVVSYLDITYACHTGAAAPPLYTAIEARSDALIAFTPHWQQELKRHITTKPVSHVPHGLDHGDLCAMDPTFARGVFSLKPDGFYVLNLNRNTQRKRWDTCIAAYVACHKAEPLIRFVVAATVTGAAHLSWDISDVAVAECRRQGVDYKSFAAAMYVVSTAGDLSDADINALYNACDIGVNTCDGEGFGLCNYEHAALGRPQVLPALGGFLDYFNTGNSILVAPARHRYLTRQTQSVGMVAEEVDYEAVRDGILRYYREPDLRREHGARCVHELRAKYTWEKAAKAMLSILHGNVDTMQKKAIMSHAAMDAAAVARNRRNHGTTLETHVEEGDDDSQDHNDAEGYANRVEETGTSGSRAHARGCRRKYRNGKQKRQRRAAAAEPDAPPAAAAEPTAPPAATAEPDASPAATAEPDAPPAATAEPTAPPAATAEPTAPPAAAAEPTASPAAAAEPTASPAAAAEPDAPPAESAKEGIAQLRDEVKSTRRALELLHGIVEGLSGRL